MWAPRNAGVFLQEIKMPQYKEIMIKLIRENTENNTDPFSDNFYNNITTMSLNFNHEATGQHKLDFDPWSDMDINGDNSIDERDVEAITKLALAYGKLSRRFGISRDQPGRQRFTFHSHDPHRPLTAQGRS